MSKAKGINSSSNRTIQEAIKKIALHGFVDSTTGAVRGVNKTIGYVAKINTEGDLAGTVDVQEYINMAVDKQNEARVGYHEGVFLSAIQDNSKGFIVIPKLYSDVVVSRDVQSGTEYITMYSHVDLIQLDSHEKISVGVKEREPFDNEDENSADIDELAETGIYTNTLYTKDSIITIAQGKKPKEKPGGDPTPGPEGNEGESGQNTTPPTEGGQDAQPAMFAFADTGTEEPPVSPDPGTEQTPGGDESTDPEKPDEKPGEKPAPEDKNPISNKPNAVKQVIDATQIAQIIDEDKSSTLLNKDLVKLKHNKSKIELKETDSTMQFDASVVKINKDAVYLGNDKETDDAVLGVELANILTEMLDFISKIVTPTMMGPQMPTNVASFITLKAKIEKFKSTHTGFLTKKVQIQKNKVNNGRGETKL